METNASIWTDQFLDQMRHHTDPLADDVVANIINTGQLDLINLIFKSLRDNASLDRQLLPDILKDYFDAAANLPAWTDHKLLDKGARFFGIYGLEITTLLAYKSLPSAYVCPKGAAVLHATGRLEEAQHSTLKFQRRIMETAQFVMNISAPHAFEPEGRAIESAMKVRLMHAAIRFYIKRDKHWNSDELGLPINQEDLAGTMLSFSALTREGLDNMHLKLDADLALGYYHVWQVAGYLMGVDPRLIPAKEADGHTLGWQILDRQIGYSDAGVELTKALIDFTRQAIPIRWLRHLPEVFIRHYCGDRIADHLKIPRYGFFKAKLLPMFMDLFVRDLTTAQNSSGFTQKLSSKLSRHLLQHLINSYYDYKKIEFQLPTSLRGTWKLQPGMLAHKPQTA